MQERVNRLGMWASEETLAVTQLLSSWKVENRFMKFDFFFKSTKGQTDWLFVELRWSCSAVMRRPLSNFIQVIKLLNMD